MSVRRAQQEIDGAEFAEWLAYYGIEPFGEERADLRMAIEASLFANANRGKNQRRFKVEDFMPKFEKKKPKSWQHMKAVMKQFAQAHNKHEEKK